VVLGFVVVIAVFLIHFGTERRILAWLRARVTWPRTGYVQPPEEAEPVTAAHSSLYRSARRGRPMKTLPSSARGWWRTVWWSMLLLALTGLPFV
jgi:hypothetical protein